MTTSIRTMKSGLRLALPLILGAFLALGCAGAPVQEEATASESRQGAEIWRTTCNRCHNARPATEFTAEQWPVIVNHMRTRADLTRMEAAAVTAFLQELTATNDGP